MGKVRLSRRFYCRPTVEVAKDLLGRDIVRNGLRGKIIETEAYVGAKDRASHAYKGKVTKRNKAAYMEGGHVYIYLVYGLYWQFNISTFKKGVPECVLIRALLPSKGDIKEANGPGKLCRYLGLDKTLYGEDLVESKKLWLEKGEKINSSRTTATSRVGIDYAGPYWAKRKLRFLVKDYQKYLPKS